MSSLKELVYDIRNMARSAAIVDDERLSFRQVAAWLRQYRSAWLIQDIAKGRTISDNVSQDLGCVEVEQVDSADCCTDVKSDCLILRTKTKIPKPVDLAFEDAITYIGTIDKTQGFEISSQVQSHWDKYNKYTSDYTKAYLANGYIYVTNRDALKYINIRGLFEDPTEAARYTTCSGNPCFTLDSEYPMTNKMVVYAKDMILKKELMVTLRTQADTDNNANGYIQNANTQGS